MNMAIGTILVVDDDHIMRALLVDLLRHLGHRLVEATNGAEALATAVREDPDLVLLDVMLPGMDGFAVCRLLRETPALADVPVVMITALDDRNARLCGIKAGADDFLSKPIDRDEVRARVQMILRLNRHRRLLTERIQRTRAEAESQRHRHDLTVLNRVIAVTAAATDVERTLHSACRALALTFASSQALALRLNPDSSTCTVVATYPTLSHTIDHPGTATPPPFRAGDQLALATLPSASVVRSRYTLVAADAQSEPRLAALHETLRVRGIIGLLVVPIIINDVVDYTLELHISAPHKLDADDIALAQSIATATRQALEMIQLHQRLRRHAADLEQIVAERTHELRQERDRTRRILEAVGEAVVVTDCAGAIQYVNPAAAAMSGVSRAALFGQSWLAQAEASGDALTSVSTAFREGQGWQGELVMRRLDGATYHTALTLAPLHDSAAPSAPIGFVGVQRDITAMKAVEKLKEAFVLNVSHELRTPLAVLTLLSGNLEGLYDQLPDAQRLAMIYQIRDHTRRLSVLVEDILQLSQLVGQDQRSTYHPADLAALVREEIDALSSLAQRQQQTLVHTVTPARTVQGNPSQLRQIIRNLITNAIKYTPSGGKISCEIGLTHTPSTLDWPGSAQLPAGSWVALQVSDTGSGILPEALPYIFERFYRGQSEGPIRGTGLGLAIVAELVAQHGGHIAVRSTTGAGSVFAVYLPFYSGEHTHGRGNDPHCR